MSLHDHRHPIPGQADDLGNDTPNGIDTTADDPVGTGGAVWQGAFLDAAWIGAAQTDLTQSSVLSSPAVGSGTVMSAAHVANFVINVTYDSVLTALKTTNLAVYNAYTAAIQTAVTYYEGLVTSPVTINITFGYGEVNGNTIGSGTAGASESFYNTYSYSTFYNAVKATLNAPGASALQKAAFATLSAADPTGGTGLFSVTKAEQLVLGLSSVNTTDGYAGLSSSLAFDWTQPNSGSTYDAIGVIEHEISEVMGRSDDLGAADANTSSKRDYTLLDFFHYAAAGGASNAAPGSAAGVLNEPFVAGYNASLQSYFSANGTTVTLPYDTPTQVAAGADVADWSNAVTGDSYGSASQGATDAVSATDQQVLAVLGYTIACFLPGTRIATPSGDVAVETLRAGDMVLTQRGDAKPITWIGHGKALATPGRRNAATPVIVRKDALADQVPNADLRITKGHSLAIDGVLIPVEFLVNHRSILWDDRAREVEVYHIELAVHDVLLANGAPAESYRDDGNRWLFQNANTGWHLPAKPPCGPVLTGGSVVDAIWQRLLARSGSRLEVPLTREPDLHLVVDGYRLDGHRQPNGGLIFRMSAPPAEVRIVSRADAPDELGHARDPRILGVALRRIIIWRGLRPTVVAADDPCLCDGFHAYEQENDFRWTNGDAILPASLFQGGDGAIGFELHVGCISHYRLPEAEGRMAA